MARFISASPGTSRPDWISIAAALARSLYVVHTLVHVEEFASPQEAIAREKQLKNWHRDWKIRLIDESNPDWNYLSQLL